MFLQLIDRHFPPTNKLHKIFNRNTVKVSYSCIQNISEIIYGHNKKVTQMKRHHQLGCDCRTKPNVHLMAVSVKNSTVLTTFQPKKVYLSLVDDEFKKKRYDHTQSFRNENYLNSTTLSSCFSNIKKTKKETSILVWKLIQTAWPYTNATKRCSLCLHETLAIPIRPHQSELLNKRSELV